MKIGDIMNKIIVKIGKIVKPVASTLFTAALFGMFASCFGMKSDIALRADGSGLISLEYTISNELLALGTQDGNASSPIIPAGKKDFEEAVNLIDGLNIASYSSKHKDNDTIYSIKLEYKTFDALAKFMDTQGGRFRLSEKNGKHILNITIVPTTPAASDPDEGLIPVIFEGYNFNFAMSFPSDCVLNSTIPSVGNTKVKSRSVEYSAAMSELFLSSPVAFEIVW
jgi:hypothetical protein